MLSFKRFAHAALALAVALVGTVAVAQSGTSDKGFDATTIYVGRSIAQSGPAEVQGRHYQEGADLYFKTAVVNGRKISVTTLDDGYNDVRAKENTEKLLKQGVFALFGYMGTPTTLKADEVIEKAGVPLIAPMSGADSLLDKPMIFNFRARYADEIKEHILQLSWSPTYLNNMAIFFQNDSYGKGGRDTAIVELKKLGAAPVAAGSVERNSDNVADAVKEIGKSNAKAVLMICAEIGCEAFTRQIRTKLPDAKLMTVSFSGNEELVQKLGPLSRGLTFSEVTSRPLVPTTQVGRDYLKALEADGKIPKRDATFAGLEGYAAAKFFCLALERTGPNLSRARFIETLQSGRPLDIGGIEIAYSSTNHRGSKSVYTAVVDSRQQYVE